MDPSGQPDSSLVLATCGSVLAGAIFGDHCSPISDTTVLSSQASGCNHLAHVRTQMPYALAAAAVCIATGTIPSAFGVSPWISLATGSILLFVLLRWLGKPPHEVPRETRA
jgi:Na+/H+ antiporter NhaC